MPEEKNDSRYTYSPEYIADILGSVKTIAVVGASANEKKPSYRVLKTLHEVGYEVIPVNPNPDLSQILGIKVAHSLDEIEHSVDMVDVFRPKEELYSFAEKAIKIGAKVLWGQLGIYDDKAARLAEAAGLKVVMDRCPKIELLHPHVKQRLGLED